MNPSVDVGCPPRPFRHLRMAQRRSPDPSSSRVPVHSALVQISVTRHHQLGRSALIWMLGKICEVGKWEPVKSWQEACKQRAECTPKKLKTIEEASEYFRARNLGCLLRRLGKITCPRKHGVIFRIFQANADLVQSRVRLFRIKTQQVST